MKVYTVIGFYRDNDQPFIEWVKARTPQEACKKAKDIRKDSSTGVVDVIEGKHKGCLCNETIVY